MEKEQPAHDAMIIVVSVSAILSLIAGIALTLMALNTSEFSGISYGFAAIGASILLGAISYVMRRLQLIYWRLSKLNEQPQQNRDSASVAR